MADDNITTDNESEVHPKVFISYSHGTEDYQNQVLEFSNRLRSEGIDAEIDQYEEAPSEGWPRWMEKQIKWADYVIVLASKSYYDRFYDESAAKGLHWEVNIIYNELYAENTQTQKLIPAFFESGEEKYIPEPLRGFTYYNITEEYTKLYNRLRGISSIKKPPLGRLKPVEEKRPKTLFISTPIDLDKWNKAGWKGVLYAVQPGRVPVLGLVFTNYKAGIEIFKEWRNKWGTGFVDENMSINFVLPPFPADCYVYKSKETNNGVGYFVSIEPNTNAAIERAVKSGLKIDDFMLTMLSRNTWVDERSGSTYRDMFMVQKKQVGFYEMVPAHIEDMSKPVSYEDVDLGMEYAVKLKSLNVKIGTEIKDNDPTKAVLEKTVDFNEAIDKIVNMKKG